jgi:protease YdgD
MSFRERARLVMRCLMAWLFCLGGMAAAAPVQAEPLIPRSERPGLASHDTRRPVDAGAAPWRSLGRVQTELGGRCTGTLVAPDQILTAAHCLMAPQKGRLVQPGSVHVLLGYDSGRFTAHRRVAAFRLAPGYEPARHGPLGADWALLRLEQPMDAPALPLRPARDGDRLVLGGYQQDRPEVLMADPDCPVLGLGREAGLTLLLHGCAGTRGASGAPLLRREAGGGWSVVGMVVAARRGAAGGAAIPAQAIGER